jgi:uncharacterized protein YutE (UPF0331/DUF86 family)
MEPDLERLRTRLLEEAIDIAVHILEEDSTGTPEEYGSAFPAISELGIIDADLASRLRSAAGMRNVLVNDYLAVDSDLVWEGIERVGDLVDFAERWNGISDE